MGSHDLARINRISYDTVLEKGDKIIVYEVADPSAPRAPTSSGRRCRARAAARSPRPAKHHTNHGHPSTIEPRNSEHDEAVGGPVSTFPTQVE